MAELSSGMNSPANHTVVNAAAPEASVAILSCLSSTDPEFDGPSYALLELTPDLAGKLLELHAKGRDCLVELTGGGVVSDFQAPSFGLREYMFRALRTSERLEQLEGDGPIERLSVVTQATSELCSDPDEGDLEVTVRSFRVHLHELSMAFSARAKHCSVEFMTERIPLSLLRQAAGL